jgi:hypothetical protein
MAVEPLRDRTIGELACEIPLEGQTNGNRLNRVWHRDLAIPTICVSEVGAISLSVQICAGRAVAPAIAKRDRAIVKPFASTLDFSLAGFLTQVVDVDFGQHTEHREGQLAPGGGQIEILAD